MCVRNTKRSHRWGRLMPDDGWSRTTVCVRFLLSRPAKSRRARDGADLEQKVEEREREREMQEQKFTVVR